MYNCCYAGNHLTQKFIAFILKKHSADDAVVKESYKTITVLIAQANSRMVSVRSYSEQFLLVGE